MKRALAAIITGAIGAGVLWAGLRRDCNADRAADERGISDSKGARSQRSNTGQRPAALHGAAERIELLLERARRGDVAGYLSSFCGAMRAHLEQAVKERGPEVFAAELRRFGELEKSHAVFAAEPAGGELGDARVTVETVFRDRTERQTYRLKPCAAGWLVDGFEGVRDQVPKHAVGSLATYQEPEGVPVP